MDSKGCKILAFSSFADSVCPTLNCSFNNNVLFSQDGLVRQSLTTQKADALLKSVAKNMCSLKHDLKVANHVITSLLSKASSGPYTDVHTPFLSTFS